MTRIDRHPTHTISWTDLAASDIEGATSFYGDLMGWSVFEVEGSPYRMFMSGDQPVAGAMQITPEMAGMPPVWTVYVAVDDADATAAAVTGAGGMVAQPPFVINADGQRIAIVLDPANAALGIFEGSADNGIRVLDEPGAPCWFDCRTRNADASEAFYRSLFGWSFTAMDGPMDYRVAELGGQPIAGLMAMGDEVPAAVPSHWGVSFSVPDADAAAELTASRGGSVTMPPMDTPFGRSVSLVDPWGAAFMVIDRSSATT